VGLRGRLRGHLSPSLIGTKLTILQSRLLRYINILVIIIVRAAHASHHRHLWHMIRVSKEDGYRSIPIPPPPLIKVRPRVSPIIVRDDIDGDSTTVTRHSSCSIRSFHLYLSLIFASWSRLDLCTLFNLRSRFFFLQINVCTPPPSLFKTAGTFVLLPVSCVRFIACPQLPSHGIKNDVHHFHRRVIVKSLTIIIVIKSL
jgi:hypothetical protein